MYIFFLFFFVDFRNYIILTFMSTPLVGLNFIVGRLLKMFRLNAKFIEFDLPIGIRFAFVWRVFCEIGRGARTRIWRIYRSLVTNRRWIYAWNAFILLWFHLYTKIETLYEFLFLVYDLHCIYEKYIDEFFLVFLFFPPFFPKLNVIIYKFCKGKKFKKVLIKLNFW